MAGALVGNLLYKRLAPAYLLIMRLGFILAIFAYLVLLLFDGKASYFAAFFLLGMAVDAFRIATMNLLFAIAPPKKRPLYIALQNNLTAFGLFFAIPGGVILRLFGYEVLYGFSAAMLALGLAVSFLQKER
jgi:predicted MFS family arabinose efflux permease